MTLFSRTRREQAIDAAFADADSVSAALGDVTVPPEIAAWLGRLHALLGVPFEYLVPDGRMLPPESIRFFRLDDNWIRALLDGAFSLGRNLTADATSPAMNLDRALLETVTGAARAAAPRRAPSAASAGRLAAVDDAAPWTGLLLRSRVVTEYPGLGVNVYPQGHTPDDAEPQLLETRRLDRLAPDTLLCLVAGDAYRVDVHEAPELLHFGLDTYGPPAVPPATGTPATKELRTFRRGSDGTVTLTGDTVDVPVGAAFRARSPRVLGLAAIAGELAAANSTPVDAAEMGFAMTQGVGMVSFIRRGA